jgi:hypothetical protein
MTWRIQVDIFSYGSSSVLFDNYYFYAIYFLIHFKIIIILCKYIMY